MINNHTLAKALGEQRQEYGCKPQGTEAKATMILSAFTRGALEVALLSGCLHRDRETELRTMLAAGSYLAALELIEQHARKETGVV